MSAATQTPPNAVERISKIPLVHETLNNLLYYIHSYSLPAAAYARGESLACSLYENTKGVQNRLPLATANSYANKSLDYVQTKIPYVFEVHSEEIVKTARKPADAAIEMFNQRLQAAQGSLSAAQDRLASVVAAVPRTPEEAQQSVHEVLTELNKIKDHATTQVKEMPKNAQSVVTPLVDSLNTGIHDITAELSRKDVPIGTRAANVLKYSRDNTVPVIQETLNNLKGLIVKKKEQAEEKAGQVQENGATYADKLKENAIGPH